jgi:hypothetical protein
MRAIGIAALIALSVLPALALEQTPTVEQTPTDQQIIDLLIRQSRQAYYATGHPCACPEDHARNGSLCGGRSAYIRPGGAEPLCYPKDVTKAAIDAYRAQHR